MIDGAGSVRIRTSEDFWDLTDLPTRFVVLGGGPIGCELGQAMARLGSQVTIVHRGRRILPKEDEDASRIIHDALLRDGATVRTSRTGASISSSDGESGVLILDDGSTIEFDVIVAALGRAPRADALGLEHAGVRTDADGYVAVHATLRTTNPGSGPPAT
ncbi:FAD-dependent oxidoreductase [Agromyces bauzanensis]|uniref:FAD/NAD(P)-binding domain-containing protein n=1 Tax=Agromyces bauzanensis TaxID=1308924 RepID=A0A917UY96_9MICO|nr:FAD-dependent oxidoreductase [Agromyces bauzanensis]GGJ94717.1 hypothetical protein GCM10011372_36280 [Agromyces bauzanensis]